MRSQHFNNYQSVLYLVLSELGTTVDRTKNPNKKAVVDKAINELEKEIKQLVFIETPINSSTLSLAVGPLNNRIRFNGLTSQEILYQHDQLTGKQVIFQDGTVSLQRERLGEKGHYSSAISKSKCGTPALRYSCNVGDFIMLLRYSCNVGNFYLVVDINKEFIMIQKFVGSQLLLKKYLVKFDEVFPAVEIKF